MLRIFKILGIAGIMSLSLVSCFAETPKASNKENYLKYCGEQQVDDYKKVYVYEDNEHKKIIYFANDSSGHSVSVAVTDMKE